MNYRFYYGPDDYSDAVPEAGRIDGVQAIVQFNPGKGWYVESHGDYYLLKADKLWHAADDRGTLTELKKREMIQPSIGTKHKVMVGGDWIEVNYLGYLEWLESLPWVLHGETLANKTFHETFQQALAEADRRRRLND